MIVFLFKIFYKMIKPIKSFLVVMAVAFMFATDIFADNVNLPVVELFGRNYYV